jgi:hypothetical protein
MTLEDVRPDKRQLRTAQVQAALTALQKAEVSPLTGPVRFTALGAS